MINFRKRWYKTGRL